MHPSCRGAGRGDGCSLRRVRAIEPPAGTVSPVNTSAVRAVLVVVGVIALVVGAVFAGQGLNLIPGSFMTGDRTWLFVGVVLVVIGVVLLVRGLRPRRGRTSD